MACANLMNRNHPDVDALKDKISCEYLSLLSKAMKGYVLDYEFILEEISFVNLIEDNKLDSKLSLSALQYYLNNKWQMIQS